MLWAGFTTVLVLAAKKSEGGVDFAYVDGIIGELNKHADGSMLLHAEGRKRGTPTLTDICPCSQACAGDGRGWPDPGGTE